MKDDYGLCVVIDDNTINSFVAILIADGINRLSRVKTVIVFQIPNQKRCAFASLRIEVFWKQLKDIRVIEIHNRASTFRTYPRTPSTRYVERVDGMCAQQHTPIILAHMLA